MANNKLQLRANILKLLNSAKQDIDKKILDYNKALEKFKEIEDVKILSKIILKEFKGNGSEYDYFLSLILTQIAPKEAESKIFEAIMSDNETDSRKIHFINLLKEINKNADYGALLESIKNPNEIEESEMEKFANDFILDINHQIDFMDFYFASNLSDKMELVNNLTENSSGDEAASILSLISYTNDEDSMNFIIEMLGKTRSYLAIFPLEYIVENSKNNKYVLSAKKALNELKISGLRKKISQSDLYKEILSNSRPLSAWVTNVDGASNFVLVYSRERQDLTISFFSVIVNLKYGVAECFGFENLERFEFRDIAKNIYNDDKIYQISVKDAVLLLKSAEEISKKSVYGIPYEYFAWRTLTYDIETLKNPEDEIKNSLNKITLVKSHIDSIKNAPFFKSWFLKADDSKEFIELLNEINLMEDLSTIDGVINKYMSDIFNDTFDKQLFYQAYILHLAGQDELSNILNTMITDESIKKEIQKYILKKSILFYYDEQSDNIFAKNINKKVAKEIKNQWEKEF